MNGEYTEQIPNSVGKLIVTKNSWYIRFYFSGPDSRYNGTFFNIQANSIESYAEAYRDAWNTYSNAKIKMPPNGQGELKLTGKMNLNIRVGGYLDGICLTSYHMPLRTEKSIEQFIESLLWAKKRAIEVMELLFKIS